MLPVRRIYTVPPGRPFLTALAEALLAGHLPSPGGVRPGADAACRRDPAAADAAGDAGAAGGVPRGGWRWRNAAAENPAHHRLGRGADASSPARSTLPAARARWRRPSARSSASSLLAVLVQRWADAERGGRGPEADIGEYRPTAARTPAQAARLARELARLMDAMEIEDVDYAKMRDLVPDTLAAHWETTLDFLRIVTERWPAVTGGRQSKMQRDKQQVLAQASQWRKTPPDAPVIVAGVMSSVPAVTELLRVVAGLPNGALVLPGLDQAPRRGELANDRAGASRASAVRPQEAARCAGGAARGRAAAARARADDGRAPARGPGERGHAPGQDDRALASFHGQGRQAGDGAGRGRRRHPGGTERRGRGGGDRAHPARGGRDARADGGAGDARPPAGAARRRQARGVGPAGRGLGRPGVCQDCRRRAARSRGRSGGQALRAGGAGLAVEASPLPARHAGRRAAPRRARARACRLPHALLRPGAGRRGGGAGAGRRPTCARASAGIARSAT